LKKRNGILQRKIVTVYTSIDQHRGERGRGKGRREKGEGRREKGEGRREMQRGLRTSIILVSYGIAADWSTTAPATTAVHSTAEYAAMTRVARPPRVRTFTSPAKTPPNRRTHEPTDRRTNRPTDRPTERGQIEKE
jgi:hypothetical protein